MGQARRLVGTIVVSSPSRIEQQINKLVEYLMRVGLSNSQNPTFRRSLGAGLEEVTFFSGDGYVSSALKNHPYDEIYRSLAEKRTYTAKMLDGALIQMTYMFSGGVLQRHRLAFFPAPSLEEFQNNPEIYLEDEIYADVVAKNIVPFPIRFDYDVREGIHAELEHPKSHLTLGQYRNCRIPVTAPVTPLRFIDFVLRNFYHTAFAGYAENLPSGGESFAESILPAERNVIHAAIPVSS